MEFLFSINRKEMCCTYNHIYYRCVIEECELKFLIIVKNDRLDSNLWSLSVKRKNHR